MYTQFLLLLRSYTHTTWYMYFSYVESHNLFRFPLFIPNVLLFQDLLRLPLVFIVMSSYAAL